MRTLFGLVLVGAFVLNCAGVVRAQGVYVGGAPSGYRYYGSPSAGAAYPGGYYAFKNESLLSVNNSYLGYGNFVYYGPDPPAPGYVTRYGMAQNQQRYYYAPTPAPAPVRQGGRWLGWRRGYR